MSDYTRRVSEYAYPALGEHADSIAVGNHTTAWFALRDYHRAWCYIDIGDMVAGASLDVWLEQATTVAGAGAKAITGKAITQMLQASGHGDDWLCIELQTEELDVTNNFDCIRVRYYVGGAAVELSITLFAIEPRFMATPTTNWHEVVG